MGLPDGPDGRTQGRYGPDAICERAACTLNGRQTADHNGGSHLDPRDRARYDGLITRYAAMPGEVRRAAQPIMLHLGAFGPVDPDGGDDARQALEVALHAAFNEIDRLRQQVAHVQNDRDRGIRDAQARAADCDHHGHTITGMETQLTAADQAQRRTERARLALLAEHHTIQQSLDALADRPADELPAAADLIAALRKVNNATSRRHQAAFRTKD